MVRKGQGWHGESRRHGLSRKGVRTVEPKFGKKFVGVVGKPSFPLVSINIDPDSDYFADVTDEESYVEDLARIIQGAYPDSDVTTDRGEGVVAEFGDEDFNPFDFSMSDDEYFLAKDLNAEKTMDILDWADGMLFGSRGSLTSTVVGATKLGVVVGGVGLGYKLAKKAFDEPKKKSKKKGKKKKGGK